MGGDGGGATVGEVVGALRARPVCVCVCLAPSVCVGRMCAGSARV